MTPVLSINSLLKPPCCVSLKTAALLITIDDAGKAAQKIADLRINPLYYVRGAVCHPSYIPLDRIFQKHHSARKAIRPVIKNILVTMGGSDTYGFTPHVIRILGHSWAKECALTVIRGPASKHSPRHIQTLLGAAKNTRLLNSIPQKAMLRWMQWADLAICAGGNTLFELACTGTPSISIASEPFEEETVLRMQKLGVCLGIPFHRKVSEKKLSSHIKTMRDYSIRRSQSRTGKKLVDGKGVERIVTRILTIV